MWAFGKAAAVGFVVVSGGAGWWVASVTVTVWELASETGVFAGREVTADRSSDGVGETEGGVNFAVALEPQAFVMVEVPRRACCSGFLHLCNEKRLPLSSLQVKGVPGGSVVLLETNLVEPPVDTILMNAEGKR